MYTVLFPTGRPFVDIVSNMRLHVNKFFNSARLIVAQWRLFKITLVLMVIGGVFYTTQSALTRNISVDSSVPSLIPASAVMDIFFNNQVSQLLKKENVDSILRVFILLKSIQLVLLVRLYF